MATLAEIEAGGSALGAGAHYFLIKSQLFCLLFSNNGKSLRTNTKECKDIQISNTEGFSALHV
jgi:hypothetical protein